MTANFRHPRERGDPFPDDRSPVPQHQRQSVFCST